MSVEAFSKLLADCDVSPLSLQWFPVWVERYAAYLGQAQTTRGGTGLAVRNRESWHCAATVLSP